MVKFPNSHKGIQIGDSIKCNEAKVGSPIEVGDIVKVTLIEEDNDGDILFHFIYHGNMEKMFAWRFEKA